MALVAAAVLLSAVGARAQDGRRAGAAAAGGIAVERRGEPTIEASAGGLVTVAFLLRNRGGRPVRVRTDARVPAGWQRLAVRGEEELARRDSAVHLLAVRVPADARPGPYTLVYRAETVGATGSASDSVTIAVQAVRALALSVAQAPRFVEAGEAYEVIYLLRNDGNVPVRVELDLARGSRFPARLDSTNVALAPGESRPVRVSVETDTRLPNAVRHPLTLRARVVGSRVAARVDPRGRPLPEPVTATSVVEVIAAGISTNGGSRAFPLRLALRGGWPWGNTPAVEVSGRGPLSQEGDVTLDLLLRGPRPEGRSLFGEQDEYRLELRGRNFMLGLGDRVYDADRLVQPYWYGFGAGGSIGLGALELGGFAASNRRVSDGPTRRMGFVGARLGASRLRLLYDEQTGLNGGRTWGGQGVLAPIPGVSIAAEYSASAEKTGANRPDAHAIEVLASRWRVALRAQRLRVDLDYPGDYRGLSQDYASLGVEPLRGLRATAWLNRSERIVGGVGFGTRTLGLDVGYRGYATLMLRSEERSGAYASSPYERRSRSARLRLGADLAGVRLNPEVELGSTEDLRTGGKSPLRRYMLRASGGTEAVSLSGWVDRLDGQTAYLAVPQAWVSAGAQARLQFGQATWLRAAVTTRRFDDARLKGTTVAELAIEHRLPFGHSLATRARSVGTGPRFRSDETDAIVEYSIPFAVPLPGGARGQVIGRVYDAQTGAGLADVPVRVDGRTALTDANGRVRFDGLRPGTYYITLDRVTAGIDRVPLVELPLRVDVRGGDASRFEIGLLPGGRVSGVIRRYTFGDVTRQGEAPELLDAGGVVNALVELSNGTELQRRMTDENGRFDFGLLRPGRWTLAVRTADLPRSSALEGTPGVIDLVAGDTQRIELRMVPVRREVQIVRRGEITVRPNGAAPARAREGLRYREVQPDDRGLMDVARKEYGDPSLWPKIWTANRAEIADPDVVYAGQRLVIPPPGPLTAEEREMLERYRAERAAAPAGAGPRLRYREVQPDDRGLMDIARKEYGDPSLWPKIWIANRAEVADPDVVYAGQRLVIPPPGPLTPEEREMLERYRERGGRPASPSVPR